MPCRSDYLESTQREKESKRVATLLVYLFTELNQTAQITKELSDAVDNYYGEESKLDEWTALLCSTLRNLSQKEEDAIVYNARDKKSRKLATWWENHQAWDKKREAEEKDLEAKKAKELEEEELLKAFNALPTKKQQEFLKSLKKLVIP